MYSLSSLHEIERKIRYVSGEAKKMGVEIETSGSIDNFIHNTGGSDITSGTFILEALESKLDLFESQLADLNKYSDKLASEYQNKVILIIFC